MTFGSASDVQCGSLLFSTTTLLLCNVFVVVSFAQSKKAAAQLTGEDFIASSTKAVVQVIATKQYQGQTIGSIGTGFVIPPNDLVVTASHVVTERQQLVAGATPPTDAFGFPNRIAVSYLPDIKVKLNDGREVPAKPITAITLLHASGLRDYCVLRLENVKTSAALSLGTWDSMSVGDDLTAWGFPLGLPGPVMIKASVALKHEEQLQLDPKKEPVTIRSLIFQGPNNKGMSGGPVIHNRTGKVVAVVSKRLVGISEELAKAKGDIVEGQKAGSVTFIGVDPLKAILGLIDVLDQFLMSGMGSAVPVDPLVQELK